MIFSVIPERAQDIAAIHQLNAAAFGREEEACLVDSLRQSPAFIPGLSLVALSEEGLAGHILFTPVFIVNEYRHQPYQSLALAPMAVHPQMQRKGVGGQLVLEGLRAAQQHGFTSVIVLGHEHYYPRFGFRPAAEWGIRAPFNVPSAAFMAIELVPGALKDAAGLVAYPEAFGLPNPHPA